MDNTFSMVLKWEGMKLTTQEQNSRIQEALYFFKLSADLGNSDGQFYVALMTFFRLDGSYNIYSNLTISQNEKLYAYSQSKHISSSLVDLYFSALQGNKKSQTALGFKHLQGIGVEKNCSNAALYYLSVLDDKISEYNLWNQLFQRRRIALIIYESEFYKTHEQEVLQLATIFDQLHSVNEKSISQVKLLADSYFYGIHGLERNYEKAFHLYALLSKQQGDQHSAFMAAKMIIEDLVADRGYTSACQILETLTQTRDSEFKGQVYNALGYLHYKGLLGSKDIPKAHDYFKQAAELNNVDAIFNLGSLYLLPSSLYLERNVKKGRALIEKAALLDHRLAQYSFALMLLDGVDLFYSCDLAANLLSSSVQSGPWADNLMIGNQKFYQSEFNLAFPRYLESAFYGFTIGKQNAAVILEMYETLKFNDDHFSEVQSRLQEDPIFQRIEFSQDPFKYLYSDYLQLIDEDQLKGLLKGDSRKLSGWLIYDLFHQCSKSQEAICSMKLGDYYYYGKYEAQNFERASYYYLLALKEKQVSGPLKAHILFNLGYMYLFGEGFQSDPVKSKEYFEKSIKEQNLMPILSPGQQQTLVSTILEFYEDFRKYGIDLMMIRLAIALVDTAYLFDEWAYANAVNVLNFCLVIALFVAYSLRLRTHNQP